MMFFSKSNLAAGAEHVMGSAKRLTLRYIALVLFVTPAAAQSLPATKPVRGRIVRPQTPKKPCEGLSDLRRVADHASMLTDAKNPKLKKQAKSPRTAIEWCYEKYEDSEVFRVARPETQERFLYDYVQAALFAAKVQQMRGEFLARAVIVGQKYVDWYRDLERAKVTLPKGNRRVVTIVEEVGDSLVELGRHKEFLNWYQGLAPECPTYFANPGSIETWDKVLRYDPVAKTEMRDRAIKDRVNKQRTYAKDWAVFRQTLTILKTVSATQRTAEELLEASSDFVSPS
jgi:hypothetical protein